MQTPPLDAMSPTRLRRAQSRHLTISGTPSPTCGCLMPTLMRQIGKSHASFCILIQIANPIAPDLAFKSHLERAKWVTRHGYRQLLRGA
jgi:hypothetical protein